MLVDTESRNRPAGSTPLLVTELNRYAMDIVALSERHPADIGQLGEAGEGFIFFWKGKAEEEARVAGVGFTLRSFLVLQLEELPVGISQ